MVGSAIVRAARDAKDCEILTAERASSTSRDRTETERWIGAQKPDAVFLAAAKVGGIQPTAPTRRLPRDNLAIALNVIAAFACRRGEKLLFLGSSCIYPKLAPQPMTEDMLLTGPLSQPTNGMRSPRSPASSWQA